MPRFAGASCRLSSYSHMIALLDRANVAYAKLTMMADLGFSEAVYGLGAGLFFLGYFLFEIPGALIVERWSARWWISRILFHLGLVHGPGGFREKLERIRS